MSSLQSVTDADFKSEVLQSGIPVLVDFWAPWCGPCKTFGLVLDEVAPSYAGRVKFVKVDVDHAGQTAAKYGIRSVPTVMIFQDGKIKSTQVGGLSKSQLTGFLNSNI